MSFILDALKKSETDRQQQSGPDISSVATTAQRSTVPRSLIVLTGVLSGTVIVLLIALWRAQAPIPPQATQADDRPASRAAASPDTDEGGARSAAAAKAATVAPSTAGQPEDNRSEATASGTKVTRDGSERQSAETAARTDAAPERATVTSPAATVASEPAPAQIPAPVADTETFLTFNDLRATGRLELPDMHIDLHVYSEVPTERFVFINMNQYRENAMLSEGPRLRQIREDGVLLEYVGTTFLLPRE